MIDRWNAAGEMIPLDWGFYVRASDYDALEARLAEAERLLQRIMVRLADLLDEDQFNDINSMIENADSAKVDTATPAV